MKPPRDPRFSWVPFLLEKQMAYTYLDLTNKALREVNEVPLTQQQFVAARGLQQFAKEAVNRAFFDISNVSSKWPWSLHSGTRNPNLEVRELSQGVQWYDLRQLTTDLQLTIDWNTFLLTDKDLTDPTAPAGKLANMLEEITYDEWIRKYRTEDFTNQGTPKYVIRHSHSKFGFSPVPDQTYWVEFNCSNEVTRFTDPEEVVPIPEEFITVILARVKYYLWLFRENHEQANFSLGEYREGLTSMKRILLSNREEHMRAI